MTQMDILAPRDLPNLPRAVTVRAVETEPVAGDWSVEAEAICVTAGTLTP